MKRYIRSSYYSDPWEQTTLIDREIPKEIENFMSLEDDEVDYTEAKKACEVFWRDYEKFPNSNSTDSLDMRYSDDQRRFYNKYYNFALKCKRIAKSISPSGYGRTDYVDLKARDLLRAVDYNFPYGWRYA